MTTIKSTDTIAHNVTAMNKMLVSNHAAIRAGGECPECGEGANPTILAHFGHCLACQTAAFRGEEAGR